MFLQPHRLGYHPFRAHRSSPVAIHSQRVVPGGRRLDGFLSRAHIHPDDGRHQRVPSSVEGDDRAARRVDTHPDDIFRVRARRIERPAHGEA